MREDKTPVITGFSKSHRSDSALCILPALRTSSIFLDYEQTFSTDEQFLETDTLFIGAILFEYYTGHAPIGLSSSFEPEKGNI